METQQWIIDWFVENTQVARMEIEAHLGESYFELGWLDSLGFINFLMAMEERFNMQFDNEDFNNRDFTTISGLARRIESSR